MVVAETVGVGMIVAVGIGVGEENVVLTKIIKAKKAIHRLKGKFFTFYASFLLKRINPLLRRLFFMNQFSFYRFLNKLIQ